MEKVIETKTEFVLTENGNHLCIFQSRFAALGTMHRMQDLGWRGLRVSIRIETTTEDSENISQD